MTISLQEADYEFKTADEMLEWLAEFGKTAEGGVTRLLYSKEWIKAQHALKKVMLLKGFDVRFDEVGNLFGRYKGTEKPDSVILTGSHIDTVKDGGKFDGAYGIAASLLAAHRLFKKYGPPKRTIDVVSLAEEEGSRFPLTFWGSGWITGRYSLDEAEHIKDETGISLKEAMNVAGFGAGTNKSLSKKPEAFVEIHVEQGILLEKKKKSIGIVSHIVGQRRYMVQIKGESNHAGTTPMLMRKDAMRLLAEFIVFVSSKTEALDQSLVATIGKVAVKPNMPNVIAGEVECSLDIRHHKTSVLNKLEKELKKFQQQAQKQGLAFQMHQWLNIEPVGLDKQLVQLACEQAEKQKFLYEPLVSGAGHDAQVFGEYCPTMLLFVPSQNGISHSPDEWTKPEDLEKGVKMLTELLYQLAY